MDIHAKSIIGISHVLKGPMSKEVLPQGARRISEESLGIHTDQSHQNQLCGMINIDMLITFNFYNNTFAQKKMNK